MIVLKYKTENIINFPCLKMIAVGRAYDLLRADVQEHLTTSRREIGYKYCRFHALFHDDMDVVYLKDDGTIGYHWHHVDKVYDFLLSIGMKPFVELSPMPKILASGTQTMFWYKMNVTRPKSFELWFDLIKNFIQHITERYGNDEVKSWFFEVWNEPNLNCFWAGDMNDYFNLYEASARAVKEVCSDYKIGGPATATCDWINDIIDYCFKNNLPLDFISTHLYPQDEYCLYKDRLGSPYEKIGDYFKGEVKRVKDIVLSSKMPNLPIFWTEFNTLSTDKSENITFLNNTALDRIYGASCLTRCMVETADYSDGVAYWTVSDIFEEEKMNHAPFSGTYGLLTIHGIKKATYNAMLLLKQMSGKRIELNASTPLGAGIIASEDNGTYKILMYNCCLPEIKEQLSWRERIFIPNINAENYIFQIVKIEKGRGSAYEEWLKMGSPVNLTPLQEQYLRSASQMHHSIMNVDGEIAEFDIELKSDEVAFIEVRPKSRDIFQKITNEVLEKQLNTGK